MPRTGLSAACALSLAGPILIGCGDIGPVDAELHTFISDPYVIATVAPITTCDVPASDDQFAVLQLEVEVAKASTLAIEPIPDRFVLVGRYGPDQLSALPMNNTYGIELNYTADLALAIDDPSASVLGDLSSEGAEALIQECALDLQAGPHRILMGPVATRLQLEGEEYCNVPYIAPEACWPVETVHNYLATDGWRGETETYDAF